jgi:hypothetical protein
MAGKFGSSASGGSEASPAVARAVTSPGYGMRGYRRFASAALAAGLLAAGLLVALGSVAARAETCTTQSGLSDVERDSLANAARGLAAKVQTNDAAGLRTLSVDEVAKDFGGLQYLAAVTSPKLAGGTATLDQIYLLDAATLKRNADGSAPDAQFFCSLNRSTMEADFLIPALPPGKYGFAIVNVMGAVPPAAGASGAGQPSAGSTPPAPWRLSFLLRQEQGKWLLAGFYPKPLTAAGHDGLWYWTQARELVKDKQPWNAWLYYQVAAMLLRPADFIVSTHLEKLRSEQAAAAPSALSGGVSPDEPLVVKGAGGAEYHFTGLGVDDSLGQSKLDIAAHLRTEAAAAPATPLDPAAARQRNSDAMAALLAAYPEMRKSFHGVWVYAEASGERPFATEQPMAEIK